MKYRLLVTASVFTSLIALNEAACASATECETPPVSEDKTPRMASYPDDTRSTRHFLPHKGNKTFSNEERSPKSSKILQNSDWTQDDPLSIFDSNEISFSPELEELLRSHPLIASIVAEEIQHSKSFERKASHDGAFPSLFENVDLRYDPSVFQRASAEVIGPSFGAFNCSCNPYFTNSTTNQKTFSGSRCVTRFISSTSEEKPLPRMQNQFSKDLSEILHKGEKTFLPILLKQIVQIPLPESLTRSSSMAASAKVGISTEKKVLTEEDFLKQAESFLSYEAKKDKDNIISVNNIFPIVLTHYLYQKLYQQYLQSDKKIYNNIIEDPDFLFTTIADVTQGFIGCFNTNYNNILYGIILFEKMLDPKCVKEDLLKDIKSSLIVAYSLALKMQEDILYPNWKCLVLLFNYVEPHVEYYDKTFMKKLQKSISYFTNRESEILEGLRFDLNVDHNEFFELQQLILDLLKEYCSVLGTNSTFKNFASAIAYIKKLFEYYNTHSYHRTYQDILDKVTNPQLKIYI